MPEASLVLLTLLFRSSVRDGDMPTKLNVKFAHFCTEENAVCRGIALTAEQDMQMYHFMKKSILHFALRQVEICAY